MKKVLLTILTLAIIIPMKVYALDDGLTITCNNAGLYVETPTTCTISAHIDDDVTGLEAIIGYDDEEITISSFQLTEEWESFTSVSTVTPGTKLTLVAKADENSNEELTGDFNVATFNVTLNENATSTSQEITLSSILYYDENVHSININGVTSIEFSDFIDLDDYEVDTTNMIIYRLSPLTIGAFKTTIASNAVLKIFNSVNNVLTELTDIEHLATGQIFRAAFKTNNRDYKISVAGDVLGNGEVSVNDGKKIAQHIIDGDAINGEEYLKAADYDNNGNIKMNDVMRLLNDLEN